MICSLWADLSFSPHLQTVDDNGSETRYRKTVLDRYVSMTADNVPFLSPSISETLSLSLSLSVFLNQETGWFFVINDNKPDARCYISEFFIDSDISIMETRSHESHARWKGKRRMNREFLAATGVIHWDCDIEFACRVIITGSCASPRNVKCKKTRREKKRNGGRKWRQRRNETKSRCSLDWPICYLLICYSTCYTCSPFHIPMRYPRFYFEGSG